MFRTKSFLVVASLGGLAAGCVGRCPPWDRSPRTFRIGVYLNNQAPIKAVFRELADAGVDLVWIGGGNYGQMVEQGLHRLAHAYDIDLYVQLFAEPRVKRIPEQQTRRVRAVVDAIDRQPHPEVVVGYGLGDEIEMNYPRRNFPRIERTIAEFVDLVRRQDPRRITMINHFGTRWYHCGEAEPWASVFYCIPDAAARIDWRLDQARYQGHPSFVLVAAARSLRQIDAAHRRAAVGLAHLRPAAISARTARQDLRDYLLAAYEKGSAGCVVYIFDGKPNDAWSLTDQHLHDPHGKWAGFRDGVEAVKRRRGEPIVRVRWPWETGGLLTAPVRLRARISGIAWPARIAWDLSPDGGLTWRPIGQGATCRLDPRKLPATREGLLRVRPFDRRGRPGHFRVSPVFENLPRSAS